MSKTKKVMIFLGAGLFSLAVLCSPVLGQGFRLGFKIMGGINYQLLGDANASLQGMKTRTDDYVAAYGGDLVLQKTSLPFLSHLGYEFDIDAILYFSPQFGISFGLGYVRGGTLFGSGHQTLDTPWGIETDFMDVAASAIPIKVGVYYTFSSGFAVQGKNSSYVFAGIGLYNAKCSVTDRIEWESYWEDYSFQAKASGLGFHAGIGGENWINPNFAFVYELSARYAKIGGLTGDWQADISGATSAGSGTLYNYEWLDSGIGNWYPETWVMTDIPSGPGVRNVKEAQVDFTGISFKFGIKFNI